MYHDRTIRAAIAQEDFALPPEYETKLQNILQKQEAYDSGNVMRRFRVRQGKRRVVLALVSVMLFSVCLVGAGKYVQHYTGVDMTGGTLYFSEDSIDQEQQAVYKYTKKNLSYGQFCKYYSPATNCISRAYFDYVDVPANADREIFFKNATIHYKTPAAIPPGYTLSYARVYFYLDDTYDKSTVVKTEKSGKLIYQIFDMPEGFEKNIAGIACLYENEAGDYLMYDGRALNNGVALFDETADIRDISLKDYQNARVITEEDEISLMMSEEIPAVTPRNADVETLGKKEYFEFLDQNHIAFSSRWKKLFEEESGEEAISETDADEGKESIAAPNTGDGEDDVDSETEDLETFHYISYHLYSNKLSAEQLMRIAEGMQ